MATEKDSGNESVSLDTPVDVSVITDAGVYVFGIDLSEMVNGDVLIVTLECKLLTGSTSTVAYKATFAHVQGQKIQFSVPIPVVYELTCNIEQTDGTARDYDWAVYEV